MRLPFPTRIPLFKVFIFALALCCLQLLEHTSAVFSFATFCFILVGACAFNEAGGLSRPSGGFVLAFTVLGGLFGIFWKVVVGEPGNTNLQQPELTMAVYVAVVTALWVSIFLSQKLRFKSFLASFRSPDDMYRSSIGCLAFGAVMQIIGLTGATIAGLGALQKGFQTASSIMVPLAAILAISYEVRRTGGRRSMNLVSVIALALIFIGGLIGYSKQGIFTPFVAWIFPAAAGRYKISVAQIGALIVAFGLALYYLVPYSQTGRNYIVEGAPLSVSLATSAYLLTHLNDVREFTKNSMNSLDPTEGAFGYFSTPQGFADRLQMLTPDGAVINATENNGAYGIFPILFDFENAIPHILWPGKPTLNFGNMYAHEIGILADDTDITTGISFSPGGEMYHLAKWPGLVLYLPLLFTLLFTIYDSLCGDSRESPFALLMLIGFMHTAPEGGLGAIIGASTTGIAILYFAAMISARIMPLIATLIVGPPTVHNAPRAPMVPIYSGERPVEEIG